VEKRDLKSGITLVEVMISVFLVAVAAAIIYTEMIVSYRILMRSRARLEAQGLAFDVLWENYNMPFDELKTFSTSVVQVVSTPDSSLLSTNGYVKRIIRPENEMPTTPEKIQYWDIFVEVWPGFGSPLQIGTNSLASCRIRRYRGER
jgi:prepilin-type N-terminal cleavage/methylation domain-containing protein